ncbi:unnamed protein product [Calypogeia fissa]
MEDDSEKLFHDVDGSRLGGGGQILRVSAAFSALLRKGIRVTNICAGRNPPGMRMQHLNGLQQVGKLSNGDLQGAHKGAQMFSFLPGKLQPSGMDLFIDIQTAGSITLLIQGLLPILLFQPPSSSSSSSSISASPSLSANASTCSADGYSSKPSTLTVLGGTNVPEAPQIDFFIHVFLPVAERMFGKGRVRATVLQRGYFPKGGGRVVLEVTPLPPGESLKAIDLTELGTMSRIGGYIFVGGSIPQGIGWDMHKQVVEDLQLAENVGRERFPQLEKDLRVMVEDAKGGGSGLVIWAETDKECVLGGAALGDMKNKGSSIAKEATEMFLKNLSREVCVDEILQDQLIFFMALAKGRSRILTGLLSVRAQVTIWLATELTGVTFDVQELDGQRFLIECDGIGFSSPLQSL